MYVHRIGALEIATYPEGFESVDLSQFQSSVSSSLSA
jgi:hypothetical protein